MLAAFVSVQIVAYFVCESEAQLQGQPPYLPDCMVSRPCCFSSDL